MSSAYTACASSGLYIRFEHCLWLSCFLLQWPVLLAIAGVAPAIWLPSFTYCISSAFCSSSTSRSSLAPHVLRHMLSAAVHATISRFACIRYSVLLLQPTPTLPLIESRALPPPPFATSTPLQHLSSHRARRVVLASGHESNSEGDTPSRIQHSTSGLISTWRPPLQRATASLKKTIRELRTAFN